jgi:hypothetical protein
MNNKPLPPSAGAITIGALLLLAIFLAIGSARGATTPISGEPRISTANSTDDLLIDTTNAGLGTFTTHKVALSVLLSSAGTNWASVSSTTIPMGAFTTNYTGDGASVTMATYTNQANGSDAFQFFSGQTNVIRLRYALPIDWDLGTVEIGLRGLCFGTNAAAGTNANWGTNSIPMTNVVWAVKAASIANGGDESSLTFGTAVWTTNHISTSANVSREAITQPLTVGNSPSSTNSIIWDIRRLGGQAGDTMTNNATVLAEVRVILRRTINASFPAATP